MKKLVVLFVGLLVALLVQAQDLIITKDAQQIRAKITEVSKDAIRYLDFDNQEGPVFVLETSDIVSIVFANGQVKVYNHAEQDQPKQILSTPSEYNDIRIRKADTYYILGDKKMSEKEYLNFIQKNCPEAWGSYQKGVRLASCGVYLLYSGIGCVAGGALWMGLGFGINDPKIRGLGYAGIVLASLGGGAFIPASIPCLVVGKVKMNNTHEIYNESCARQGNELTFGIQASQNGIGIAMNF